jgi:signal peptidase I
MASMLQERSDRMAANLVLSTQFSVRWTRKPSAYRRLVEISCLLVCALLLFRAVGAEPYEVPTGSMAPALLGHHRTVACPHCGYPIDVGVGGHEHTETFCPNCGQAGIRLDDRPPVAGDHLLVNKNVFDWRRPRRWEMVVFRSPLEPGRTFVKRVVGLPGEAVQIHDGDVLIDGELARKSLAELKAVRVPLCDYHYRPMPEGWGYRWEARGKGATVAADYLGLNGCDAPDHDPWLVYRDRPPGGGKSRPITDESSYNGNGAARAEAVHDFDLECDLEVVRGNGRVELGITDGSDNFVVELPVGALRGGTRVTEAPVPAEDLLVRGRYGVEQAPGPPGGTYRTVPDLGLAVGKTYHVELAFVDRRLTLAIDGVCAFPPVDRPAVARRGEVSRPVRLGVRGAEVRARNVRLFRDVHYTDAGRHAVRAPVRLGAGEYFVLGDNSPNSDDGRFWSDREGRPVPVPAANLLGKPFVVHLPSRLVRWDGFGRHWEYQGLDPGRVRWLR